MDKRWLIGIGIGVGVVGIGVGVVVYRRRKAAALAPLQKTQPASLPSASQANILPSTLDPASSPVSKASYTEQVDPYLDAKTREPTAYDKGVAAGMSESLSGVQKRKVPAEGIPNLDTPDQKAAYTQGYEDGWAEGSKHGTSGLRVGAPFGGIGQIVGNAGATRLRIGAPFGGIGQIVGAQAAAPPPPNPFPFGQCPICRAPGVQAPGGAIGCQRGHQWHFMGEQMHFGPWDQHLDPKVEQNHARCVPVTRLRAVD